jgi:hypothetical protein
VKAAARRSPFPALVGFPEALRLFGGASACTRIQKNDQIRLGNELVGLLSGSIESSKVKTLILAVEGRISDAFDQ